jgi:hypothetical protein
MPSIPASWRLIPRNFLILAVGLAGILTGSSQVHVLTYHNDFARTGQNTNESVLTPANLNTNTFGQLFAHAVDGYVYAQPLYVSGLSIPGQGTHNVVFVATEHNSVYAFDADSNAGPNGGLLWQVNLGLSAATPNNDFGNRYGPYHDIDPEVGITSTPVIDLASGTMYLDAFTHDGSVTYHHRIHALSLTNGSERPFSPVVVTASVPGTGVDSVGGVVTFNPMQELQRPALTLAGGILYVCYSGYADTDPYHGWVIGFNVTNLQQMAGYVFNTTPNATVAAFGGTAAEGGIWMSGNGLAVDSANNLYFEVGNGSFNVTNAPGTEYGDSFVKLSTTGRLAVADFFTPYNEAALSANDTDLGSGGALLLPDSAGTPQHPHLMVGCGKEGKIYLIDRDNLGHFNAAGDTQIVQELPGAVGGTWSSGAYFNNYIYYQGSGDVLKAFHLAGGLLGTTPSSQSSNTFGFPGATPSISALYTNNAIAWVLQTDGAESAGAAILHAYDAYHLDRELYNSAQAGERDGLADAVKFTVPTVVNGKVYVGAQYSLAVFGLGTFLAVPTISPAGGLFTNSVTVTLADATPGVTLHYTVDNSAPSASSPIYTAPLIITNTTAVKVAAFKPGAVTTPVVSATFINSASSNFATGFARQEFYSGALRTDLENPAFSTPPTFINYLSAFETPSGQGAAYSERVSAYFTPPVTTNYVFFVCADDDADLFLSTNSLAANKHLIAMETTWSNSREWLSSGGGSVVASKRSDQFTGTTWPGGNTIHLVAGTQYYLEGVHHQGQGGDAFAATYKFAGAPDPVNGDASKLTGSELGTYAYDNTFLTVEAGPQNTVSVQGFRATFNVTATSGYLGAAPGAQGPAILYQWQSAPPGSSVFTNIQNANGTTYTTPLLALSDNGAQFRVHLTTAGAATTTANALLNVVRDSTPPVPVAIVSVNSARTIVTVAFSKPLNAPSAQTRQNYLFNPGALVPSNATLDASGTNVVLTTATPLPQSTPLTLGIAGVLDIEGNSVPPNTTITFSFAVLGANGYATEVLLDGPVAYWRLNEISGAVAHDSAGAYNATYGSAAALGVAGPRPPAFTGLENNNTGVQVQYNIDQTWITAPALNLNTNAVTITAWLYPVGSQAGYTGILMCRNGGDASGFNYTSGNQLGYTWNNNNSATWSFMSGLVVPQNQWSFVALVIQPARAMMFLSSAGGLLSATNSIVHQNEAFAVNSWIADDYGNGTRSFNGVIDEVTVFNKALSPARLAAYYQAATQGGVVVTNGAVTPSSLRFTSIDLVSGQIVLQWTSAGTLEEAPAVTGPWTALLNQNSPFIAPASGTRFYRLYQ